ncbi:hypothetical protein QBC42DRAFT_84172 [Cladorrhinum samala]|uniref:Secreted peptide n=1 Tax=Cladorrhinum samala TaxID=585594 RepID=A0AAV9HN12_9PEZI|nr:hypothetical protein QBC42DRAFT_84172 [Cladorrhinum samala]
MARRFLFLFFFFHFSFFFPPRPSSLTVLTDQCTYRYSSSFLFLNLTLIITKSLWTTYRYLFFGGFWANINNNHQQPSNGILDFFLVWSISFLFLRQLRRL